MLDSKLISFFHSIPTLEYCEGELSEMVAEATISDNFSVSIKLNNSLPAVDCYGKVMWIPPTCKGWEDPHTSTWETKTDPMSLLNLKETINIIYFIDDVKWRKINHLLHEIYEYISNKVNVSVTPNSLDLRVADCIHISVDS
jgi:hypothetical protein